MGFAMSVAGSAVTHHLCLEITPDEDGHEVGTSSLMVSKENRLAMATSMNVRLGASGSCMQGIGSERWPCRIVYCLADVLQAWACGWWIGIGSVCRLSC